MKMNDDMNISQAKKKKKLKIIYWLSEFQWQLIK